MSEERLIDLIQFIMDRFHGQPIPTKQLILAIEDYEKQNVIV